MSEIHNKGSMCVKKRVFFCVEMSVGGSVSEVLRTTPTPTVCSVSTVLHPRGWHPLLFTAQSLHHPHHLVPGTLHVMEEDVVVEIAAVGGLQVPRLTEHVVDVGLLACLVCVCVFSK